MIKYPILPQKVKKKFLTEKASLANATMFESYRIFYNADVINSVDFANQRKAN